MRIFIDLLLLISVLFAPLWVTVALSLVGLLIISDYFEVAAAFFLYDLLYYGGSFGEGTVSPMLLPYTAYAVLALVISALLRRLIRTR